MAYKIPEILTKRKVEEGALILVIMLLSGVSFGLGRLSTHTTPQSGLALQTLHQTKSTTTPAEPASTATPTPHKALIATPSKKTPQAQQATHYVASKSGSVYHLPWCSGAKRIKEANKVFFDTKEAAEAAGYRPASNCKGL
jgi:Metal binding domain of Ada